MFEILTFTSTTLCTQVQVQGMVSSIPVWIFMVPKGMISSKSQKHHMPIQANNISVISAHPVNKKKTTDTSTY